MDLRDIQRAAALVVATKNTIVRQVGSVESHEFIRTNQTANENRAATTFEAGRQHRTAYSSTSSQDENSWGKNNSFRGAGDAENRISNKKKSIGLSQSQGLQHDNELLDSSQHHFQEGRQVDRDKLERSIHEASAAKCPTLQALKGSVHGNDLDPKDDDKAFKKRRTLSASRTLRVGMRSQHEGTENAPLDHSSHHTVGSFISDTNDHSNADVAYSAEREISKAYSKHDEKWNEMFDKLVEYKATSKSTSVPQCYDQDPRLGRWVHYQRVEYWMFQSSGKGKISAERIAKLESIGFEWDPQRAQWNTMYVKLKEFHDEHGHCKVPKGYSKDPELANWVRNQRLEYANLRRGKKNRMGPDRLELLNVLGFRWSNVSSPTQQQTTEGAETAAQLIELQKLQAASVDLDSYDDKPVREQQLPDSDKSCSSRAVGESQQVIQ